MTIRKGADWAGPGGLPADGVVVADDAEAGVVVERARRAGDPVPTIGLLGGDLCRTLGGQGDEARLRSPAGLRATVDLGSVLVDGRQHWFVAHLVARRSWWHGRVLAVMNAEWMGRWDVAPRGHPNDGSLDLVTADLSFRDRGKAWRRLPQGTHVPHPDIVERRTRAVQLDLEPPCGVWLDGRRLPGRAHRLSLRVEPDALTIVV